jgi:hypothetical protein
MSVKAQVTINETLIVEVDSDPSMDGVDAPLSSIALIDNNISGKAWIKIGPNNTDWESIVISSQLESITSYAFLDGGTPSSIFDSLEQIDGGGI